MYRAGNVQSKVESHFNEKDHGGSERKGQWGLQHKKRGEEMGCHHTLCVVGFKMSWEQVDPESIYKSFPRKRVQEGGGERGGGGGGTFRGRRTKRMGISYVLLHLYLRQKWVWQGGWKRN